MEQLSSQTSSLELAEGIEETPHGPLFVLHVPFESFCRLVGTYVRRAPVLTSTLPQCDSVGKYAAKEGLIALQGLLAIYWRVEVERRTQRVVSAPLSNGTLLNTASSPSLMLENVNPHYSQHLDRRVAISSAR